MTSTKVGTSEAFLRRFGRRRPAPAREAQAEAGDLLRGFLGRADGELGDGQEGRALAKFTSRSASQSTVANANSKDDFDDNFLENLASMPAMSDAVAGMRVVMRRYEATLNVMPIPAAFVHHIYGVVEHRSSVDQELQAARQEGVVRMFYVNSGKSDRIVTLESDYRSLVSKLADDLQARNCLSEAMTLRRFRDRVLPRCRELSISANDLLRLLASDPQRQNDHAVEEHETFYASEAAARATARALEGNSRKSPRTILCEAELLVRRIDVFEANSYWITLPGLGGVVKPIKRGRKAIIEAIERKKNKEILERDLYSMVDMQRHRRTKRSRGHVGQQDRDFDAGAEGAGAATGASAQTAKLVKATETLGLEFHIMDAIQVGLVQSIRTGMGILLKLTSLATDVSSQHLDPAPSSSTSAPRLGRRSR